MTPSRKHAALLAGAIGGIAVLFSGSQSSFAATLTVNANIQVSGDGKCSLEEAISAIDLGHNVDACTGSGYGTNDQINVNAGTAYSVNVGNTISSSHSLVISGAGMTTTSMQFKTVSGQSSTGITLTGNGNVTIQNLTFKGASGNEDSAINNTARLTVFPLLTLSNVRVTGFENGAIINSELLPFGQSGSALTITSSTIDANGEAFPLETSTGGLENVGTALISNSTFSNNMGFLGGAVANVGYSDPNNLPKVTINNSTFTNNQGSEAGGAIYLQAAELYVNNSTFSGNVTAFSGPAGGGGAIFNTGDDSDVNNPIAGHAEIYASTFSNNGIASSGFYGGAIYNNSSYLQLIWSTLSGNGADFGGGVYHIQGDTPYYFETDNTTISNNTALTAGGGIYEDSSVNGNVHIQATIVAGNSGGIPKDFFGTILRDGLQGALPDIFSSTSSLGSNAGTLSSDQFNVTNPLLGPLFKNGGPTSTICPTLGSSPAVDKFSTMPSGYTPPTNLDQRGFVVPVDGDGNGTSSRDIGACEFDPNWQTENLVSTVTGGGTNTIVSLAGSISGKGTSFAPQHATGDSVTFQVPVATAVSNIPVKIEVQKAPNHGKFQLSIASSASGPFTNVGAAQDLHTTNGTTSLALLTLPAMSYSAGQWFFRFTVTGDSGTPANNLLVFDFLRVTQN
jgi:hypothetical protein